MQSKKTTEDDLRKEFEMYGAIERIRIVQDRKGKSRSFAFIVYDRERDMKGEPSFPFGFVIATVVSDADMI